MNKEVLKGNWNQAKGKIKQMWGKLTDDDMARIEGNYDELVGQIQERYGYSKEETKKRVQEFFSQMEKETPRH